MLLKLLAFACAFLGIVADATSKDAPQPGYLEGHLTIISPKTVELADGNVEPVSDAAYAHYPLIILSRDSKKEIARVTADKHGNYHIPLPPGDYLLDVHGRERGRARAKVHLFSISSNNTTHADMVLDTGVR